MASSKRKANKKDNCMSEVKWKEPVAGFEFEPEEVVVTAEDQADMLLACGLDDSVFEGYVDASFYIALGIRAGANSGITAEGNVNMMTSLIQHRRVRQGESLTVKGSILNIQNVPRGQVVETDVWFEDKDGARAISAPRKSLRPNPDKAAGRGAGERPAPVIENVAELRRLNTFRLTPERVKHYSSEGNSIHYEMEAANKAGFRAPIIGGGMGVHYLIHALWQEHMPESFDLSIFFRRPIFWDDQFDVAADPWRAIALLREDKVLTEARINQLS
jgi:hypothetical protein